MSRPIPKDGIPTATREEKLCELAAPFRNVVSREALERFEIRASALGLRFEGDERLILAGLDTPPKVQDVLDYRLYYNQDHESVDQEETAMPPRLVLGAGKAHCFEGAMFAYAVNFLHGHDPRLVMLEASQDADHNLVVWRDPATGLYGANAHSRYPGLVGRPAAYPTIRAVADSYVPFYYSDRTLDPTDLTLVGYSEPIDLVARFGTAWMSSTAPLWDIYYTYIDDSVAFRYFFDDPGRPHLYPMVRALKENWVRLDAAGKPHVSLEDLPPGAKKEWDAFWSVYGPKDGPRPRGKAKEIEQAFFRLTGTTPIDLDDIAFDLPFFLAAGYTIGQLVKGRWIRK
jgi:hypothetical protein